MSSWEPYPKGSTGGPVTHPHGIHPQPGVGPSALSSTDPVPLVTRPSSHYYAPGSYNAHQAAVTTSTENNTALLQQQQHAHVTNYSASHHHQHPSYAPPHSYPTSQPQQQHSSASPMQNNAYQPGPHARLPPVQSDPTNLHVAGAQPHASSQQPHHYHTSSAPAFTHPHHQPQFPLKHGPPNVASSNTTSINTSTISSPSSSSVGPVPHTPQGPPSGNLFGNAQPQSGAETDLPQELLALGWRRFWSKRENRWYFWNFQSNESLWEIPTIPGRPVRFFQVYCC